MRYKFMREIYKYLEEAITFANTSEWEIVCFENRRSMTGDSVEVVFRKLDKLS